MPLPEYILLEFSEKQQCFHHNYGDNKRNSNYYFELGVVTRLESVKFRDWLDENYPEHSRNNPVAFDEMKRRFEEWKSTPQN